jgi:hypothetical protein
MKSSDNDIFDNDDVPNVEKLKSSIDKLASKIDKAKAKPAPKVIAKPIVILSMAERYKRAWHIIYDKQQEWRKKEIDNQLANNNGKLSDRDWDNSFADDVEKLAESDDFLSGEVSSPPDK